MMRPRWIKILLWLLGATSLINGIAMFFAPSAWFFRLVPGVPETGPFNAHLVADSGTDPQVHENGRKAHARRVSHSGFGATMR